MKEHAPAAFSRDELLAHREWVRALAVSLTTSHADADDVEQETWLTAIAHPPASRHALGGWLATVARNAARKLHRTRVRARHRDQMPRVAAPPEDAHALAARAETHALVVGAVLALREPYRATVLLRFFEGLPVREVAGRMDVPVETARARLRRAKELLRERLSERLGQTKCLAALLLLGQPRALVPTTATVISGGALVTGKAIAAALVVAVAVAISAVALQRDPVDAEVATAPAVVLGTPAPAPPEAKPSVREERPRVRSEAPQEQPPAERPTRPHVEEPEKTLQQLLDAPIEPIAFEDMSLRDSLARLSARSGVPIAMAAEVAERTDLHVEKLVLESAVPAGMVLGLLTSVQGLAFEVDGDRMLVVPQGPRDKTRAAVAVAPEVHLIERVRVRGLVTDDGGATVEGATILRVIGDSRVDLLRTDANGCFAVELARPFGRLEARRKGHVPSLQVQVSDAPEPEMEVRLRLRGPAGSVDVRAEDVDGKPIGNVDVVVRWPGSGAAETVLPEGGRAIDPRMTTDRTGADGTVLVEDLPPGDVVVHVRAEGYEPVVQPTQVTPRDRSPVRVRMVRAPTFAERLDQPVSFSYEGADLREVVAFLNSMGEVNIVVDPALGDVGSITLTAERLPLRDALARICAAVGDDVTFKMQEPVVFITRKN